MRELRRNLWRKLLDRIPIQFRVLYRVFLLRVVDLELLSADGDPTKLLGQLAALFAAVSFLFCAPLVLASGMIQEADLWVVEHLLIATTMLVIGLFSVLSWDSIFPDKRDVLVLAPLPVAPRTIFMAKLSALAFALGVSVLALNVFTGLVWPLYFPADSGAAAIIRSFAAYWATIFAAGAFMFFSILTVQGIASQILPRQLFLRLSAWIQVAAFCLVLGMYILEPSLESPQTLSASENQRLLTWLPSYWFLGLFHQLDGYAGPTRIVFAALAGRAWLALAVVVPGAAVTLLLSYFRMLYKIVEEPDIVSGSWRMSCPRFFCNSLSSAITLFCLRTLLRSRQHRVILSFYFGIGFAIVLAYVNTLFHADRPSQGYMEASLGSPLLAASILMLCVAIGGMRIVASIPIVLQANWIFRITELYQPIVYISAVRRAIVVFGAVPVWLVSCMLFFSLWPWRFAAEHLLLLGLLGMVLVEVCLSGFQKIPFTCSYLPGKGNLQYIFWACALFLLPLIHAGAQIEMRMLNRPFGYGVILAALGVLLVCARWHVRAASISVTGMQFEEVNPPEISSLNLYRG